MMYHVTTLPWVLVSSLFTTAISQSLSLPYNPTTILIAEVASKNQNVAYAFVPTSQSDSRHQLVSLNISSTLSSSNLSFSSISANLPFVTDNTAALVPSISSADEISVFTGSCSESDGAELWRFTPSNTSNYGNGTWAQETTTIAGGVTSDIGSGADFLSVGFSFSAIVEANASQSNMYIFGGMCPTAVATTSTWQSAANYSNQMLQISPATSSPDTAYTIDLSSSRGPPITEAGFTMTGLTPTSSNNSGIVTQQRSYVLLGGHTQTAFINMSQVALWNLPEESWSFVTVDSPNPIGNTELAIKSTAASIDSRSGHTAVMTEDGTQIIVYGGWVGDVSQAADPQLAVLNVGAGFGGTGDWKWSIPSVQPSESGIYGHGAAMLPGNVMMVLGGYNISTSGTTKREVPSTQAMFYNATSLEWISSYTNPFYVPTTSSQKPSGLSSSTAKKIGLGLGIGLGLLAVIAAILVACWFTRRAKKRQYEDREKNLRSIKVHSTSAFPYPALEEEKSQRFFPWARWNSSNNQEQHVYETASAVPGYESLHPGDDTMGSIGAIPSPPRPIPRKPLHSRARGVYQQAPAFEFNNGVTHARPNSLGTAGPIHPIYEADEDDNLVNIGPDAVGLAFGDPLASEISVIKRRSDPFRDQNVPQIITRNPSRREGRSVSTPDLESPPESREREIQEWVSDWAAADALLNAQARIHSSTGRISPVRRAQLIVATSINSVSGEEDSGRTASSLSERSVAVSSISRSGSSSQDRSRSNSLRGFISNTLNPFNSVALSTTVASSTMSPVFDGPGGRYNPPRSAGSGASFNTAHTSFPALQAEGEGLLPRPNDSYGPETSPTGSRTETGSPSKGRRLNRGQMGWLGSLRRAIIGDSGDNTTPEPSSISSREGSPIRLDSGSPPRRTVSAGATLWRRKQGKGDWEDSADAIQSGFSNTRSNTFTGEYTSKDGLMSGAGIDDDDDDWDIERAVENRVVQVMFTVPKEKLRVVNGVADEDNSEVGSLRSKKGSAKSVREDVLSLDSVAGATLLTPPVAGSSSLKSQGPIHPITAGPSPSDQSEERSVRSVGSIMLDGSSRDSSPRGKGKTRVLEIVEKMEGRSSPER